MSTVAQDSLPSSVPRLEPGGANWLIYRLRFTQAVKAKGKWGHFDGMSKRPTEPKVVARASSLEAAVQTPLPGDEEEVSSGPATRARTRGGTARSVSQTGKEGDEDPATLLQFMQEQWDLDEDVALYLLSQRIPDSALIRLERFSSCQEKWAALVQEFTQKSVFAQTAMRADFL